MSSSRRSSSKSKSKSKYEVNWTNDVFLSFRGEDTRKGFISHLHSSLSHAGIHAFQDEDHESLERGDVIADELHESISSSTISIVVFSINYGGSEWCLGELEKIMECHRTIGQVVLPVFYDVDPSDVRKQRGRFGEAFNRCLLYTSNEKMWRWRHALTAAANLAGFDLKNFRSERLVIKNITDSILRILDSTYLFVADHPVGVDSRVHDMIELLTGPSTKVLIVGIWGMGGMGKSTIAKAVYNEMCHHFEGSSFLENIREVWEQDNGQIYLQQQLLSDILKTEKMKFHSSARGKSLLKEKLCHKKTLVVLDDVNNLDQLNALCGSHEWFGPGSRLIITTRDEHLLNVLKVDSIYRMKDMNTSESLELFCWHAFKQADPIKEFIELTRLVVAYCRGLPLALEVLGSYLFDRRIQEWESVLEKLKRIPNDQIHKKLKISFDGLNDDTEREIFLDISCFFIGMDRNYVIKILNDCGLFAEIGISVLTERSLVTVDMKNRLGMHDLLRDMGREIIRKKSPKELEKRSRLWFYEDAYSVLKKHTGTISIEGLALKLPRNNRVCLSTEAFKEMKKLRLLQLDHVQLEGDFECLSKDLKWLSWRRFPLRYIPGTFHQGSLVAIDLKYSNLYQIWKEPQLLSKLKVLNLSHSFYLIQSPDFSNLPHLEVLILKYCSSLSMVHHSIGDLKNLTLVNLKGCTSLTNLPTTIYKSKSLKVLLLSDCLKIDKLEEDIGQVQSLTTLIANNTAIRQVPYSIVRLKNIGYISVCGFEGLTGDVFPSLIWSWMSPTNNPLSFVQASKSMSSLVSSEAQANSFHDLPSLLTGLSKTRSLQIESFSELQLTQDIERVLDSIYATNGVELETPNASQVSCMETSTSTPCGNQFHISSSENSLRSILIQMGQSSQVTITLSEAISQVLTTNRFGDCLLPGDKYPYWLSYKDEGPSVFFEVPNLTGYSLRGMTLCIIYSSFLNKVAFGYPVGVLLINFSKSTIQLYKRETLTSFGDEEWQDITSKLEPGDKVEVIVVFGYRFTVKKTAMYLIYAESMEENTVPTQEPDKNVVSSSRHEITRVESKAFQCDDEEEVPLSRPRKTTKMCKLLEP
ncbi:disease resistance protein RUN1-like isoform X1 [Prosopis cineraria]|uniref:disease resistance protein RUN1-like isoform X1 n=1 Tax=Prosopis cineraria TaxID=364024 RepID=UPI00240FD87D|nr:disease resistance protein RUN1-like isoform X1 [Prosopis cineraria]